MNCAILHLINKNFCGSLHGGISHTEATPKTELSQKASTSLRDVLHHTSLRERARERERAQEQRIRDDVTVYGFSRKAY